MAYKYKLKANLKEEGRITFQNERIAVFKEIEERLNNIYKLVDIAEKETVKHYNEDPQSYSVVYGTDLILDYIKDIENLLTNNKE